MSPSQSTRADRLVLALLAASLALNVGLGVRLHSRKPGLPVGAASIRVGDHVPPLRGKSRDGDLLTIEFGGANTKPTVISGDWLNPRAVITDSSPSR
jgi:hypothetical protein